MKRLGILVIAALVILSVGLTAGLWRQKGHCQRTDNNYNPGAGTC